MGMDYSSKVVYGWLINDEKSWEKLMMLLPEDSPNKDCCWDYTLQGGVIEEICDELNIQVHCEVAGNYFNDQAFGVLLGIDPRHSSLEELQKVLNEKEVKEEYERFEKLFGEPPKFKSLAHVF